MRVTFLGTGAAGGVPLYGCGCTACKRAGDNPRYVRRPCSALVESGDTRVLIDAGLTDLHERFPPGSLDAIVLTHFHPDHVQGLFHLRWGKGLCIPVYAPPDSEGCADLYKHPGVLEFRALAKFEVFTIGNLTLTPLPLIHSRVTFGYAIESPAGGRFAYLTDTAGLPPRTLAHLQSWHADALALDCSHPPRTGPANHNDWTLAAEIVSSIAPGQAWLTHVSHELDEWLTDTTPVLPAGTTVAMDGDVIEVAGRPGRP
ncbi:MAG: phosphonate metabolism protein PhnP [Burkholderiaceae bacterium]|nr:phosphonate metabolism protein PhnP [Burkholderiaceae bacterium]MDZ4146452.1 phosphonate metabolism protein PhnP [Burkholderiales bacterium]